VVKKPALNLRIFHVTGDIFHLIEDIPYCLYLIKDDILIEDIWQVVSNSSLSSSNDLR
jgi:hypothetical protein